MKKYVDFINEVWTGDDASWNDMISDIKEVIQEFIDEYSLKFVDDIDVINNYPEVYTYTIIFKTPNGARFPISHEAGYLAQTHPNIEVLFSLPANKDIRLNFTREIVNRLNSIGYKCSSSLIPLTGFDVYNVNITTNSLNPNSVLLKKRQKLESYRVFESKSNIKFIKQPKKKGAKTDVYNVSKSGNIIGQVKWSSRMRGYAFLPSSDCDTEVKEFVKDLMDKRRAENKKNKPKE